MYLMKTHHLTKLFLLSLALLTLLQPVSAINSTINTSIVNSPYLSVNLWVFITCIGLFFMVLSNLTSPEQNNSLWALIAPFFIFASAYFALMMQTTTITQNIDTSGLVTVAIQQTVYHPEWLAAIMGIVFLCSIVNVWFVMTRKPIERPTQDEIFDHKGSF